MAENRVSQQINIYIVERDPEAQVTQEVVLTITNRPGASYAQMTQAVVLSITNRPAPPSSAVSKPQVIFII